MLAGSRSFIASLSRKKSASACSVGTTPSRATIRCLARPTGVDGLLHRTPTRIDLVRGASVWQGVEARGRGCGQHRQCQQMAAATGRSRRTYCTAAQDVIKRAPVSRLCTQWLLQRLVSRTEVAGHRAEERAERGQRAERAERGRGRREGLLGDEGQHLGWVCNLLWVREVGRQELDRHAVMELRHEPPDPEPALPLGQRPVEPGTQSRGRGGRGETLLKTAGTFSSSFMRRIS